MISTIFTIAFVAVALRFLLFFVKVTWEVAKGFWMILLIPLFIILLLYVGLAYFAVPILVILGLAFLISKLIKVF